MEALLEVFGEGEIGRKAEDLNRYSQAITDSGMVIPKGFVIATGIFDQLVTQFNLKGKIAPEKIEKRGCPEYLATINTSILDKLEVGVPYAIRSSALSEQGGTGIYQSSFFWPTGDRAGDASKLWHAEAAVYASEFTQDAKLWRERQNAPMGMAILIQPVVGFQFQDGFLPPLAGTAYTSYYGLPTVRLVVGMGTQAVNGGGLVYHYPPEHCSHLQRAVWDQEEADMITPEGVEQTSSQYREIHREIDRSYDAFAQLFDMLAKLQQHGNFSLEWVAYGENIFVVQCTTHEDRLPGNLSFDSNGYFLLLQSKDTLNSGRASCKAIVYVGDWSPDTAEALEWVNEATKDYLLIVPQQATSLLAAINQGRANMFPGIGGKQLSYSHFSNALAVVEKQVHYESANASLLGLTDHSHGLGASHFAELCDRTDILFLGAEFDPTPLLNLPSGVREVGADITIWNIGVEVVVDASENILPSGSVYILKQG